MGTAAASRLRERRRSVDHRRLRLERSVPAKRRITIDRRTIGEHADPRAQRRLRRERIGHPKPRLEHLVMSLGQPSGRQ